MSAKKKVLENSFLYTFSSLLVKAMGFILLPLYTYFLTPEDYGMVNLVNSFLQIAIFVVAFSLNSGITRFFIDYQKDWQKLKRFIGTIILFVTVSGIVFVILGIIFNEVLISFFFDGISFFPIVFIALLILIFLTLHRIHQSILQAMQKGKKLTLINLIVFFIQASLNLLFIGVFHMGATGMLLAQLVINIGYLLFMILDLNKNNLITYRIDFNILKDALKYSIPLLPHNLSTHIANFISRVFINSNGTLASVGLFSVATQFGAVVDTVQTSVHKAFVPWFFNLMNHKNLDYKTEVVSFSNFLLHLYSIVYVLIGLFAQEVIIIMTNEQYLMAWTVIPILILAYSVKSIYYFFVSILFYYKKASNKIFIATLVGSFADILFAYFMIPKYGMYGAAISFLLAKIIVVIIVVFMSKNYDHIFNFSDMIKVLVISWAFMGIGLYFSYTYYVTEFIWWNLFYKIVVLFIYLVYIFYSNRELVDKYLKREKIQHILKGKK